MWAQFNNPLPRFLMNFFFFFLLVFTFLIAFFISRSEIRKSRLVMVVFRLVIHRNGVLEWVLRWRSIGKLFEIEWTIVNFWNPLLTNKSPIVEYFIYSFLNYFKFSMYRYLLLIFFFPDIIPLKKFVRWHFSQTWKLGYINHDFYGFTSET